MRLFVPLASALAILTACESDDVDGPASTFVPLTTPVTVPSLSERDRRVLGSWDLAFEAVTRVDPTTKPELPLPDVRASIGQYARLVIREDVANLDVTLVPHHGRIYAFTNASIEPERIIGRTTVRFEVAGEKNRWSRFVFLRRADGALSGRFVADGIVEVSAFGKKETYAVIGSGAISRDSVPEAKAELPATAE